MPYSDPYRALRYDALHSDDLGKWAHHLWDVVKTAIKDNGMNQCADNL